MSENKTETPIEPPVDLNEIARRYPPDIPKEDFMRIVKAERENRTGWMDKQSTKGKEE